MIELVITVLALASPANCTPANLVERCLSNSIEQADPTFVLSSFQNNVLKNHCLFFMRTHAADPKLVTAAKAFTLSQSSASNGLKIEPKIDPKKKTRYDTYCKSECTGLMDRAAKLIKAAQDRIVTSQKKLNQAQAKRNAAIDHYHGLCVWDEEGKKWDEPHRTQNPKDRRKVTPACQSAKAAITAADSLIRSVNKALDAATKSAAELSGEIEASKLECAINFYLETTVAAGAGLTLPPSPSDIDILKAKAAWDSTGASERMWRAKDYEKRLASPPAKK